MLAFTTKVLYVHKSLIEQDKIECVFLDSLKFIVFKFSIKNLWFSHLNVMQLFNADAKAFKFFAHENIKKMLSKVTYFMAQSEIFITANQPKTSPNSIFCSIKTTHRKTYL